MAQQVKCACPRCFCMVPEGRGFERNHKTYCSETCAYECTEATCICVHDRCDDQRPFDSPSVTAPSATCDEEAAAKQSTTPTPKSPHHCRPDDGPKS